MSNKVSVGVFFGGKATEHEVSVISGIQATRHIDSDKYEVVPIYISKDERYYIGKDIDQVKAYRDLKGLLNRSTEVTFIKNGSSLDMVKVPLGFSKKVLARIDVALPVTHGNKGENGSLQGMFEMYDLPYAMSGVGSAAVSMDKVLTKYILQSLNVPVVPYVDFYKYEWLEEEATLIEKVEQRLGYPVIVKPASGGSSIGVSMVSDRETLIDAVELACSMDERVLVENMVDNLREINCSVLGDVESAETSLLEEPVAGEEILSFADKYMSNQTKGMSSAKREIPANIPEKMANDILRYSLAVFKAFGCSGLVRIDYIIDGTTGQVYFNEMNTIPGSLSFYLWEPKGKSYKELLDDLIKIAMKRHKQKQNLSYNFNNELFKSNNLDGVKK